ncbi:LCCL domain-containing protein [Octadecabacter sp. R77987]|uniref:LCCL domain-containing protein n=1 Tax=Octadecabacter sp. R77987 TaxID=3093874 RepID=UPI003673501A
MLNPKPFVAALFMTVLGAPAAFAEAHSVTADDIANAGACPTSADGRERLVCACPTGAGGGSVWGSGPYTGDSNTCTAARHAGAIDAQGGVIVVTPAGRNGEYPASTANGITTQGWGSWDRSFNVARAQAAAEPATTAAAADAMPTFSQAEMDNAPVCTSLGIDAPDMALCRCPEGGAAKSVWGSGPYTGDSDICTAARHAGAVDTAGGAVLVIKRGGQDAYEGGSANGVTTRNWGSYGRSFDVVMASSPATIAACSVMPADADTLACTCPADDGTRRPVYGSGPYTADSDICSAGRHAGVVPREGGTVHVIRIDGLESYSATATNMVETRAWGSYRSSIIFDRNQ